MRIVRGCIHGAWLAGRDAGRNTAGGTLNVGASLDAAAARRCRKGHSLLAAGGSSMSPCRFRLVSSAKVVVRHLWP